LLELRKAGLQK
jgi:hypothetical protein